ncbi:DUF4367 domain-containing protein [Natrialbaceae archaeon A-arb3/5]
MNIPRIPVIAVVALMLISAGCLGAIGSENGDADEGETDLPDGDELLEATVDAESSVDTVQGTQTVTMDDGTESVTTTQDVWQRTTGEYRAEIVDTDEPEQFDVVVADGTTTWLYDEDNNEVVQADLGLDQAEQEALNEGFVEAFTDDMDASVEGTETVADRDAYVLELTADGEDALYESATIWVDQETDYPLKQESTTSIGDELTMTVTFEDVTFDEEIDDEIFAFEPPEDAEVLSFDDMTFEQYDTVEEAEEVAPLELPEPEVPDEYALENVMVSENLMGWSAAQQYTDESGAFLSVSVAEESQEPVFEPDTDPVELDGVDATIREVTETNTQIEWDDDGLTYIVSGELDEDELIAVAESIVQ